jgi:hypothetical protein
MIDRPHRRTRACIGVGLTRACPRQTIRDVAEDVQQRVQHVQSDGERRYIKGRRNRTNEGDEGAKASSESEMLIAGMSAIQSAGLLLQL